MSISYSIRGACDDHESLLDILEHCNENSTRMSVDYCVDTPDPAKWREHLEPTPEAI